MILPKSDFAKALQYIRNHFVELQRYLDDPLLPIDNNLAEQLMKQVALGRKNWLFSNTANGARASAMLYSIIETAKANGLIPFDYLRYVLQANVENTEDIESLLPWEIDLREPAAA